MELTDFLKLGFNKNEARVYLSLIKFEKADARQLIQDTKFHKNIVYDNLERLIDKGLVTFIIEEGRKLFSITKPKMLSSYFEEQEKEVNEKIRLAKKLEKEIAGKVKDIPEKQEATIYRGIKAMKSFYNETLTKEDYFVFGAPQESINVMGETFWENYSLKRTEKKIKVCMIFNPSIKYYGEKIKNKYTEIKYFNKNFEPKTETHIQGDIVAIMVWVKEPIIFKINSKTVAESYKKHFDAMWKASQNKIMPFGQLR